MWICGWPPGKRAESTLPRLATQTVEVNHIVEDVVLANKVLPAMLRDGYALSIVPTQTTAPAHRRPANALPRQAAERAFVGLLMSDWRLKIARCVNPACGLYFRLGKWNHRYEQGTRCLKCRETDGLQANQDRVEANRRKAKQALHAFVARRFARRITPGKPWYRDLGLKAEIARALNDHFEGDVLFRSLYPKGITGKWLEAGRQGGKNWLMIERVLGADSKGRFDSSCP